MTSLALSSLVPVERNQSLVRDRLANATFVGIDFGTSTTVASYAVPGDGATPIKTETIPIPQTLADGRIYESHLVPSAIAWHNGQLLIGAGAAELKSKLMRGRTVWSSFKMELGVDLGPQYYNTELPRGHQAATIERPKDAAAVLFRYMKQHIEAFIRNQDLPQDIHYSVSIPASFEANQRQDLLEALEAADIELPTRAFIDEPNAAFLSYLAEADIKTFGGFQVPPDSPLHILVFDFGAGTCDISILEVGRRSSGCYSKNLAISRFEALGGDDIDRLIVRTILLPQLLSQNGCSQDDLKTPDINKRIIPTLMKAAEQLKIKLCKTVATQKLGPKLPPMAASDRRVSLNTSDVVRLPSRELSLKNPELSYAEFHGLMANFLDTEGSYDSYEGGEAVISVFTPIASALQKAELDTSDLDLILLVGGSSQNPYVQAALQDYFADSSVEIPSDLRSHVSVGAALNSLLINGLGVDMIKPITSEPILVVTRDGRLSTLIRAGTEIPCADVVIDDLVVQEDNQRKIQLPVCVTSARKILSVSEILSSSPDGFRKGTPVVLTCDITEDKLLRIKARVGSQSAETVLVHPFANRELTVEERMVLEAERNANVAAAEHGRPTLAALKQLKDAYVAAKNHLRAAETLELIQQLDPRSRHETNIGYHYARASKENLSDKWSEIAYQKEKSSITAFNIALARRRKGQLQDFEQLMDEALHLDSSASYALEVYGNYLTKKGDGRGREMLELGFKLLHEDFEDGVLDRVDFFRLINAAESLGKNDVAESVRARLSAMEGATAYYSESFLVASQAAQDRKKN